MKKILFICTGNICRSPMAEGLMRHALRNRKDIVVASAGLGASDGQRPSEHSVRALKELGVDISHLRSQSVTYRLVEESDLIFVMTRGHLRALVSRFPQTASKARLMRELEKGILDEEREVPDPIGQSYSVYLDCRDAIQSAIPSLVQFMQNISPSESSKTSTPGKVRLALGADHGGIGLKAAIKFHLEKKHLECFDVGTFSTESVDYPDLARAVTDRIVRGSSDLGILVCKTGVGMSMAANHVPSIRAALVCDEETARLSRRHNHANVLCLAGSTTSPEEAVKIVDAWLETAFEGGRHERRVEKMMEMGEGPLDHQDPEIHEAIRQETRRQQENIELIASENFTSPAILEAQGSVLTNKYAEGYPGKRYYGGCEHVDVVETLAIERAKKLFGADHANVQPHSGSQANMAVYFSVLKPGDKILTMELAHGGHLTHGFNRNFSGQFYQVTHYGVRQSDEQIDYDAAARLAQEHRPKLITVGASAYPRIIDFKRMREIADSVNSLLFVDMAHIAGLVAAGVHPSPVPHADFVTTTTHKTLRGPRGGLILCRERFAKDIDSMVLPGIQGGPLMHVIAAKAVCFLEALQPSFKIYQNQIVKNARTLAESLQKKGSRVVSGGTDNHLMLVNLRSHGVNGKQAQQALDKAGITVNKNLIPFDPEKPLVTSGIRLGTPAVTTRGMKEEEMREIASLISTVLTNISDEKKWSEVRRRVLELTTRFPLPY